MVATASPAIRKAATRVLKLSKDERARMLHEYEVKARRDEHARLDDAIEKGLERGLERGRTEGRKETSVEIARNMLERNMAVNDIADITGLSCDEIKKLAH